MAAKNTLGNFTLPSVEDLDERFMTKRVKKIFVAHQKSISDIFKSTEKTGELSSKSILTSGGQTEAKPFSSTSFGQTTKENIGTGNSAERSADYKTLEKDSCQNEPMVGRTFQETFAFLKDSDHYKEVAEKIQAACSNSNEFSKQLEDSKPIMKRPNAIIVNPRQKGNPVLKYVRNVPWEFGDIIPDYVLGQTTCALFLSLRYHNFNPDYIHERLKQLGSHFGLRILLVQVDVKDPHHVLKEFNKMCVMANCTLILSWSAEEAGRYLETYKMYENKPPDALQGRSDGDFMTKLADCLTTIKGVNKTDVTTLLSAFGSLKNIGLASKEDLAYLPGFGSKKAERLYQVFHEPFLVSKKRKQDR